MISDNLAAAGAIALPVADVELEPYDLDPGQIVSGDPRVALAQLSPGRGVWEITPGVVTDVEADEIFVVLTGRATIEVEGGATVEVGPGDVCLLAEGAKTTWTVHETLRKVYHSRS
ncbi:cupin domain-containing protein [Microtetraspora malaysiensis]|uniref:Cupin domain-containing protein n=1 Tax=Microtetraspora malaysiensis TaxID=161358 RepID=A0ABW6T2E9_9ACTN|nr:cupin domain-containing protein [Microtetraspora malaysiensis]